MLKNNWSMLRKLRSFACPCAQLRAGEVNPAHNPSTRVHRSFQPSSRSRDTPQEILRMGQVTTGICVTSPIERMVQYRPPGPPPTLLGPIVTPPAACRCYGYRQTVLVLQDTPVPRTAASVHRSLVGVLYLQLGIVRSALPGAVPVPPALTSAVAVRPVIATACLYNPAAVGGAGRQYESSATAPLRHIAFSTSRQSTYCEPSLTRKIEQRRT